MKIIVYPEEDAIYVQVAEGKIVSGRDLDDARHLDLDADGKVIGVEFLYVKDGIDLTGIFDE